MSSKQNDRRGLVRNWRIATSDCQLIEMTEREMHFFTALALRYSDGDVVLDCNARQIEIFKTFIELYKKYESFITYKRTSLLAWEKFFLETLSQKERDQSVLWADKLGIKSILDVFSLYSQ